MAIINVVLLEGSERQIEANDGDSVMSAIRGAGIDELAAICGGVCSCATCHVWVDAAWIEKAGPSGPIEEELLDGSMHRATGSRLSCQIGMTPDLDGLRVKIAPED